MSYTPIGGRRFVKRDRLVIENSDTISEDGGSEGVEISPPEGEIWDITNIEFRVVRVGSGVEGQHEFRYANSSDTSYPSIFRFYQDASETLRMEMSRVEIDADEVEFFGSDEVDGITPYEIAKEFQKFVRDTILLSDDDEITLRYNNSSNTETEEEREYIISYDIYE